MRRFSVLSLLLLSAFAAVGLTRAADTKPDPSLFALESHDVSGVTRALVEQAAGRTKPYSVYRVLVPTAAPSGEPANDLIPGREFVPSGAARGAIVILPIWKGRASSGLEEIAARYLALRGFRGFIVPMAYQWERAPEAFRRGELTLSADLDRTRAAIVQTVKDARKIAALLEREDGIGDRVGILGTSLGGFVGALAFAVAPEFRAGVFALAGAGVSDVLLHESSETRAIIRELRARGVSEEEVRRRCVDFDPETYSTPERGDRVLLYGALFDRVVPPESTCRLARSFGEPTLRWVPAGHYTAALFLPDFLRCAEEHFARHLR